MSPPAPTPSASLQAAPCPCGLPAPYDRCCGRWHDGAQQWQAPSAELLMRSRYCAFVLQRGDYLLGTWHPSTRPASPLEFSPGQRWLGLDVRGHGEGPQPHQAWVEFVARSKEGGRAHRLHERSRFEFSGGQWWYLDGEFH